MPSTAVLANKIQSVQIYAVLHVETMLINLSTFHLLCIGAYILCLYLVVDPFLASCTVVILKGVVNVAMYSLFLYEKQSPGLGYSSAW